MVHDVAAVPWLQFMVHVMLFPMINDLYFTLLLSEICVQCLTCSSLMSYFPYLSSRYCPNDFDIISIVMINIITITVVSCCTVFCCCDPHYVRLFCEREVLKCLRSLPLSSNSDSEIQIGLYTIPVGGMQSC